MCRRCKTENETFLENQQELGLWFFSTFESIIRGPFQFITMD